MKIISNFYQNNKKIIWSILLLVIIYKILLFNLAFLNYYYTFKIERFNSLILLNFWNHWDAGHYLTIAQDGYSLAKSNMAFFPLYPLLIKVFSTVLGFKLAAYFINFFALIGTLIGLFKLVKLDFEEDTSWRSIFYLLLFPTAIFLTAFYTESLFLLLTIWTFYLVRKKNWLIAGVFGLLAGLTRIESAAICLFMIYEYLNDKNFDFKKIKKEFIYCFFPLIGILLYSLYLKLQFGQFLIFLKSQASWGKTFTLPWQPVGDYLATLFTFDIITTPYYLARAFDLIFFISSLALGSIVMLRLRISYGLYVIASVLMVSFTSDLASTNRRAIILFPLLILLAKWGKNPIINFAILMLFTGLFALFTFRFVHGLWAG